MKIKKPEGTGPQYPFNTIVRAFRGHWYAQEWRGQWVVRSWPKKRGPPTAEGQRAAVSFFREMVQAQGNMMAEEQVIAREIATGTSWTYRDVLARALNGRLINLINYQEVMLPFFLDQLCEVNGAMVARVDGDWVCLLPPAADSVLAFDIATHRPVWIEGAPGGINELTGDVLAGPGSGSVIATLADTGPGAGTYLWASIQLDDQGRVVDAVAGGAATTSALGLVIPDGTSITVDTDGTIHAPGAASYLSTDPFSYPSIVNSVVTTADGSNVYFDPAGVAVSSGDAYRLRAVIGGYSATKGLNLWLLDAAASTGHGYVCAIQADSNVTLNKYNAGSFTALRASGGSWINQRPENCLIEMEIVFGPTANQVRFPQLGSDGSTRSGIVGDNVHNFNGGSFYIGVGAPSYADVHKVSLQRLN